MRPRSDNPIAANPVFLGALTVLVVAVAMFLAYNANNGLPFVPTYDVNALVPDAAELVAGNDVDVGGARVGRVARVSAGFADGRPVAVLRLVLDKTLEPLPADTRVTVRQRSNIGLKYVELLPGHARAGIPQQGTLALGDAIPAVDLDQVLNTLDPPTRRAAADAVSALGTGLAGRGADLGEAFASMPRVMGDLEVVGRTLAGPGADLRGFVDGAASAAAAIAPVAEPLRALLDGGASTFAAIDRERAALRDALAQAPAAEDATARGFAALTPLLREGTALAREAEPGVRQLPSAAPALAAALRAAGPSVARARALAPPLDAVLAKARALAQRPSTTGALARLTDTVRLVGPLLATENPMQTRCDYLGLWARNVSSIASEGDALGTWFRFIPILVPDQMLAHAGRSADLHFDPLPDVGPGGECEVGNETYAPGQIVGPVPGRQPDFTEHTIPGTLAQNIAAENGGGR